MSGSRDEPPTRLFVALWPSPGAVEHLSAHLAEQRPASDQLRWQPPNRWHVTLAFLGGRSPGPVHRRLASLTVPPAGSLQIAGSGTFGPVLWLGVAQDGWLDGLARAVRGALTVPTQPYRPHVTVARVRGRAGQAAVGRAAAAELASYRGPAWTPGAVTLVSSVTGPAPSYLILETYPFPPGD